MTIPKNKLTLVACLSLGWAFSLSYLSAASVLENSGFEDAVPGLSPASYVYTGQSNLDPWYTTSADGLIEVWSSGYKPDEVIFNASVGSGIWNGGNQFIALDTDPTVQFGQPVEITTAGTVDLRFLQRGVTSATEQDILNVQIWYYGFGVPVVLYESQFGATNNEWTLHEITGLATIPEGADISEYYEVIFSSYSPDGTSATYRNLIDNVELTVGQAVPEPSGALLALGGGLLTTLRRRRAR